ncbi:MAG: glycosyltransferase [Desulfuromonadales bacterium]
MESVPLGDILWLADGESLDFSHPHFWFAAALLIFWLVAAGVLTRGRRKLEFLRRLPADLPASPPRVSVVAAARNEAKHLRGALTSLLCLDYPDLEFVLVNDRSEDATGAILDAMAAADPRLRIVHVAELPAGWLGKNHALWAGSRLATGELLLFTDADIRMHPSALKRAVSHLRREGLDHLAATPEVRMPGVLLNMFAATFALFFSLYFRPWRARAAKSRAHIGIGAFNLVRAAAYRQAGGHQTIRLRPDDDVKLGKIIKSEGFRQDVVLGAGMLAVEWYASVAELVRGLEKNAFAGTDYSIARTLGGAVFQVAGGVWPYVAVFASTGATRLAYLAVVALITAVFIDGARANGFRRRYAFAFPLTCALFAFILLRTMLINLAEGGIRWRGTFYPLRELKQNKI